MSLFLAKTTCFFYLAVICLNSLRAYADKLREEHEKLAKPLKKSKVKQKRV